MPCITNCQCFSNLKIAQCNIAVMQNTQEQ